MYITRSVNGNNRFYAEFSYGGGGKKNRSISTRTVALESSDFFFFMLIFQRSFGTLLWQLLSTAIIDLDVTIDIVFGLNAWRLSAHNTHTRIRRLVGRVLFLRVLSVREQTAICCQDDICVATTDPGAVRQCATNSGHVRILTTAVGTTYSCTACVVSRRDTRFPFSSIIVTIIVLGGRNQRFSETDCEPDDTAVRGRVNNNMKNGI